MLPWHSQLKTPPLTLTDLKYHLWAVSPLVYAQYSFWSFLFVLSEHILAHSTSLLVGFYFMGEPTWTKSQAVNWSCLGLKPDCILRVCVPKGVIEPLWALLDCSGKWQGRAIPHRVTLDQRKHMSLDTLVLTRRKVLPVRESLVIIYVWCMGTESTSHGKQTNKSPSSDPELQFSHSLLGVNACWVRWA